MRRAVFCGPRYIILRDMDSDEIVENIQQKMHILQAATQGGYPRRKSNPSIQNPNRTAVAAKEEDRDTPQLLNASQ